MKIIDNIERDNEVRSKKRLSLKRNSSFFFFLKGMKSKNMQNVKVLDCKSRI